MYWPVRWRLLAAVVQTLELFRDLPEVRVRPPRQRSLPALRRRAAAPASPQFHSRRLKPSDYSFPGWVLLPFRPRMYWGLAPRSAERGAEDAGRECKPDIESSVPTFALLTSHSWSRLYEALRRLKR